MGNPSETKVWRQELPRRSSDHLRLTPRSEDVQVVLTAISHYEEVAAECSSYVVDWETGLDPLTVDEVIDYLWMEDMIECRVSSSRGREPSASDIRRVLSGRERHWGPWGRYRGRS